MLGHFPDLLGHLIELNIQILGKICDGFETIACVGDQVSFLS